MPENLNQPFSSDARTVFIISDGTGITAETLANSILAQFDWRFNLMRLYFTNTLEKAQSAAVSINEANTPEMPRPIVFYTLAKAEFSDIIKQSKALHFDLMQHIVVSLENELGQKSAQTIGTRHKDPSDLEYRQRIEAINFTLAHDDGQSHKNLAEAKVILVGVSRSGKTPTCLYLAMQYGIKAANYPLIPEDFERGRLPSVLLEHKNKLFGLSIDPVLLSKIRHERRQNSFYASIENCRNEVQAAEKLMQKHGIRWLSTSTESIEEIASTITYQIPATL